MISSGHNIPDLSLKLRWWKYLPICFLKKFKKVVDIKVSLLYNDSCVTRETKKHWKTGCGSAWLERLIWDQEVAGSNPVTPICTSRVE